jgi:5-methylthioadenosine/S-adenosylhomocysteine deaminase
MSRKPFAVRGAYVVKGPGDVVRDHYVVVEGDTIREITPKLPEGITEVLGGSGDIVMPGLINTHTHAAMTLFRGYADDLPLMTWLKDYIFPAEATFVDPEFVYLGTLLAAWEMTRSGTTAFCDGYFFEDEVGRAAREVGIRAWLGEGILQFPSPSLKDPSATIEHSRSFVGRWLDDPLVRPTVFPHAVYTCNPDLLERAYALAEEHDLVFQIHLSETSSEVQQAHELYGTTPARLLDSLGCLSSRTLAAHCVFLDDEEISLLAQRGVSVAHNAESNMKLASGIASVTAMIARGVNVTVGTDGCASNNNLDMISELSTVAKLHKVSTMDPTVIDDCTALAMATVNAAQALKFDGGRLEAGMPADIVTLDGSAPNLVPIYNPVSHIVYAANGANVKDVVIAGKIVVRDFTSLTVDEKALLKECRRIAETIRPN